MSKSRAAGGERVPRLKRIRRQLLDGKPIDLYDANFLLRWLDELLARASGKPIESGERGPSE